MRSSTKLATAPLYVRVGLYAVGAFPLVSVPFIVWSGTAVPGTFFTLSGVCFLSVLSSASNKRSALLAFARLLARNSDKK